MSKYIDVDKIPYRNEVIECKCHNDRWEEKVTRAYKRDIDAMTPADVAPVVHGHWISSISYSKVQYMWRLVFL